MPTLLFEFNQKQNTLNFKQNCIIFSANGNGKSLLLKHLENGINGKLNSTFLIDSLKVKKDDYSTIFFDEETDFNSEFKFTNTNAFRNAIYNSLEHSINSAKILSELNSVLDKIDTETNKYINSNIHNFFKENIEFDINIRNLDQIINKFTDIYVDGLSSNNQISKSKKRLLIYQLLLLNQIKSDMVTYILIDDFDLYLDTENSIKILKFISDMSNKFNCHFILTTSNPVIYSFMDDNYTCYKIATDSTLIKLDDRMITSIIKDYIILKEFNNQSEEKDFAKFSSNYYNLITNDDIKKQKNIINYFSYKLGIILTSNFISISLENNFHNICSIQCQNINEFNILKLFCNKLLTNYQVIDMI